MFGRQGATSRHAGVVAHLGSSDEGRLIRRVAAGDMRAFEALYRIYHPRLTRFLVNMLQRPHMAEEVLNDTMMVVWGRADSYNGSSKVSTWIFGIAYRKGLKALRRIDDPIDDKILAERQSADPGPEQQVGDRQVQAVLQGAMGELSAEHRAVVDLTYFHEIGYREIAEIMACPVDTVKTRMFHARRRLKQKLEGRLTDWL